MRLTGISPSDSIAFRTLHTDWGDSMKIVVFLLVVASAISLTSVAQSDAARGKSKIKHCLKTKNCVFTVSGIATEEPRMSFVVEEKLWKTFTVFDKNELKHTLKAKITEANEKPDKYIHVSKKSPSYDRLRRNIENMRSYSVIISYGKTKKGDLQLDEEILINY